MSLLRIIPRENFFHAGSLPPWSWRDPRSDNFEPTAVLIDLGRCQFVWPAAVAWCATYGLLVRNRGLDCDLIVPEDVGVATYLKSTGLFAMLKRLGLRLMTAELVRHLRSGPSFRSADLRLNLKQSNWQTTHWTNSLLGSQRHHTWRQWLVKTSLSLP